MIDYTSPIAAAFALVLVVILVYVLSRSRL